MYALNDFELFFSLQTSKLFVHLLSPLRALDVRFHAISQLMNRTESRRILQTILHGVSGIKVAKSSNLFLSDGNLMQHLQCFSVCSVLLKGKINMVRRVNF